MGDGLRQGHSPIDCSPLVTWYENDTGSAGQMVGLATADKCDNVLLEWELTLALAKYPKSKMKSVFPVIHGGHDRRGYLDFPFENLSRLPNVPFLATKAKVVEICVFTKQFIRQ